uniref:ATPase AAA-type core domain-containing protein n=1 Tax=Ditylenchus dipsaci TaxID=166011 RepID=A0A915EPK1_9BILA
MIQSRTRGMLARKKMKKMREHEHRVLGLTVSSLLQSKITHRKHLEGFHNLHISASTEQDFFYIPVSQIQLPTSLNELVERFRSELFIADPLELESRPEEQGSYKKYDQETENLLQKLTAINACRVLNQPNTPHFDELTSFSAQIQVHNKKSSMIFDLRNFLYLSVVIPHVIGGWQRIPKSTRHSILLIGPEGSGKSTWASAVANKCGALRITITKKTTRMGRKRFYSSVLQLVNADKYSFVLLDRLELFSNEDVEHKNTLKQMLRALIQTLVKDNKCQVIGMTRDAQLEPEILDLFSIRISIEAPPVVPRFELIADTLSRRLEAGNLHRMPRRLLEVAKVQ